MRAGGTAAATPAAPDKPVPTVRELQSRTSVNNLFRSAATADALAGTTRANPFAVQRQVVAPPAHIMAPYRDRASHVAAGVALDPAAAQEQLRLQALADMAKRASEGSDGAVVRKMEFAGIKIGIETDVGQARMWRDPKSGEDRATIMRFPYGYIYDSCGMDDGSVDVFVGPVSDAKNAYVILINKPPTFDTPDEEKVFLGFTNIYDAIGAFLQHYGNEERFIRKVSVVPVVDLAASLRTDGVTGTPEGSEKTESRDTHPTTAKVDPTSRVVDSLEESKVEDSEIDEEAVKTAAAYFTAKIAAEPATTSIPGFAPYNVTVETGEPERGAVQREVLDRTIYPDTRIEDLFRRTATNAMQTDHLISPGDVTMAV